MPNDEAVITWIVALICLIAVVAVQFAYFGKSRKGRKLQSVSSFFHLSDITERWQRNTCAIATSIPLSFIYLIVVYSSKRIDEKFLTGLADKGQIDIKLASFLTSFVGIAPTFIYPALVLVFSFLVFGAQLIFLHRQIEKALIFVSGISHRTDELAGQVAAFVLTKFSYNEVVDLLERQNQNKLPLPEELEDANDRLRLAFQLVHLAKPEIPKLGLRKSLLQVINTRLYDKISQGELDSLNQEISNRVFDNFAERWKVRGFHFFAGIVVYLAVCGLYIGTIPLLSKTFAKFGIGWYEYSEISSLVEGVYLATFGTILPAVFGVLFFAKRSLNVIEANIQKLFVIFSMIFLFSGLIHFSFMAMKRLGVMIGIFEGSKDIFMELPEIFYILSHSLIPALLVLAVVAIDRKRIFSWKSISVAIIVVSVGHLISTFGYENVSKAAENVSKAAESVLKSAEVTENKAKVPDLSYAWHQAFLGFVLSAGAFGILKIFWQPAKHR